MSDGRVYDDKIILVAGSGFPPDFPGPGLAISGNGTLKDPKIIWICTLTGTAAKKLHSEKIRAACNRICKQEAIERHFRCVVIRKECHSNKNSRDPVTKMKIVLGTKNNGKEIVQQEAAKPHITVFMGEDYERCQVSGHIYCTVDKDDIPIAKTDSQLWVDRRVKWNSIVATKSWRAK